MWIRIRAVIIEDEPLAAQYLATLLDDTCQVEIVGTATKGEEGLRLCAELRPGAAFLDIHLPGQDGVSLATQLAMLPQPPRLVFTTGHANRAPEAFRLTAVDYLLKPLDPDQVSEAVNRLQASLRPWVHTVREEFATYYPLADLPRWLRDNPFIPIGRHAVVNLHAIERVTHYGDRLYRVRLRDRVGTELTASRTGVSRLAAVLKVRR